MICTLPESVELGGAEYPVRWDYRPILDICAALHDPELSKEERVFAALDIFYPGFDEMPPKLYQEAADKCFWFINCGETDCGPKSPKLVDWEQDFNLIAPAASRVLGRDVRSKEPLHWWSFLGAYMEVGDCTFAQVVSIRDKQAHGETLDKTDRKWYRRNRHLVDFKTPYAQAENDLLKRWM